MAQKMMEYPWRVHSSETCETYCDGVVLGILVLSGVEGRIGVGVLELLDVLLDRLRHQLQLLLRFELEEEDGRRDEDPQHHLTQRQKRKLPLKMCCSEEGKLLKCASTKKEMNE